MLVSEENFRISCLKQIGNEICIMYLKVNKKCFEKTEKKLPKTLVSFIHLLSLHLFVIHTGSY